jgi:1-acyl-sn-glycerol-3-phosphate acyltransferase
MNGGPETRNPLYALVKFLLTPVLKIGLGLKIENAERFPREGAVIVAPNHVSNFDPVVIGAASPRQLHFLAKAELFRIPVFSGLLRRINSIPLHRKAADREALVAAIRVLEARHSLLVFPEGTRSKTGRMQEGKRGVGMLAVKNLTPVLPVHISGTFRILPVLWKRRVVVRFGMPIDIEPFLRLRLSSKELYRRIGAETMNRIRELRDAHHD